MNVSIGTDVIFIPRIQTLVDSGSLPKILRPSEIKRSSHEHIAGRIALKEAAIKALGLSVDDWLNIVIGQKADKPTIQLLDTPANLQSISCSVSHDGDYVFATVIALYDDA